MEVWGDAPDAEGATEQMPYEVFRGFFPHPSNGGTENHTVRGDIVFFTTRNGGGVFSSGSMAWCGSLSHDGYDNNVSRMTRNVLERFRDPAPLG